jgi:hypothetical protein
MAEIGVTFDTCSMDLIVKNRPNSFKVRAALEAGLVRGFYCETLVALEGVRRKERPEVLSRTRPVSQSSSTGKYKINMIVGIEHYRPLLNPALLNMIRIIEALGMGALRGPARMCGIRAKDDEVNFFDPHETFSERAKCMEKVNEMASAISARGIGYAVAVNLGLQLLTPDEVAKPTLWFEGLRRKTGHKRVVRAFNEWADGDAVAAHYGYGIDLFCTEDEGRGARGPSVFDDTNR